MSSDQNVHLKWHDEVPEVPTRYEPVSEHMHQIRDALSNPQGPYLKITCASSKDAGMIQSQLTCLKKRGRVSFRTVITRRKQVFLIV